jgi:hypothetical protein
MKDDDPKLQIPANKKLYHKRILEVNPDQLIYIIFDHLGSDLLVASDNNKKAQGGITLKDMLSTNPVPSLNSCSDILSGSVETA